MDMADKSISGRGNKGDGSSSSGNGGKHYNAGANDDINSNDTLSGVKRTLEIALSGSISGSGASIEDERQHDDQHKSSPGSRPRQQLISNKGKFYSPVVLFSLAITACAFLCSP